MARIFQDGFEMGLPAPNGGITAGVYTGGLWQAYQSYANNASSIGVQRDIVNSGRFSLRIHSGDNYGMLRLHRNLGANLTEYYDRIEIRVDNVRVGKIIATHHYRDDALNVVASIRIDDTYALRMYVGGIEVGMIVGAVTTGSFARVEVHYKVDNTNGVFEVRVNGNSQFTWNGNTDPLGTGHVRYLCLGRITGMETGTNNNNHTYYYDDVAVNDTTGTINNSWCGKGSILLLQPKGEGHYNQFIKNKDEPWNMFRGKPYTFNGGTAPQNALDENPASMWSSVPEGLGWIAVDTGLFRAATFRAWGEDTTNNVKDFNIKGSLDGVNWTTIFTGVLQRNNTYQDFALPGTTAYRFYRFDPLTPHSGTTGCRVYDIRLFASVATKAQHLTEIPHDEDTTYAKSEIAGDIDTYDMPELVADLGINPTDLVVKAVQVCVTGRYEGTDAHLAPMFRIGTTDEEGNKIEITNDYSRCHDQVFSVSPFTGLAWTHEEVDALEAGVRHKAHTYG